MRARGGASDAIRSLLNLAPSKAVVLRGGQPVEVPTSEVVVGDLLLVRPGAKLAIGYNTVALPIAAGAFVPAFGLTLRPETAALSMAGSSLIVAVNALALKRLRLPTPQPAATPPPIAAQTAQLTAAHTADRGASR